MSFTKVAPAGIGTEPGTSIRLGDSLLHSTGLDIGTGTGIGVTIRQHGDATFTGIVTSSVLSSTGQIRLPDGTTGGPYTGNLEIGNSRDFTIVHDSNHTYMTNRTGDLYVGNSDSSFPLRLKSGNSLELFYTSTKVLETSASAITIPVNLSVTGNLGVGGVLTYEDVTNIDSVGVVTARTGIKIGPSAGVAGTFFADGSYVTAGVITATTFHGSGANLTGISAGTALSGSTNNTVCTVTGANAIQGEANLTFDGNKLSVTPNKNSNNDGFEVVPADGTTASHFKVLGNNNAGADGRNGGVTFIDANYYADGSTIFDVAGRGSSRFSITGAGYVTKPNTPAFHVSRTSGDVSQNNYVIFNTVSYNNGSHYNNTDGKFTAPVTGIYFFSAWHFTGGTSAFGLRINGSQFGEYAWDDTGGCATWVCPVTANQYVQIYTHKTWRGSASYHNGFCGYLIG